MELQKYTYESMGTHWEVTIWDQINKTQFTELMKEILLLSKEFDHAYSRFIKTSLVWELSTQTGVFTVPTEFISIMRWYKNLYLPSEKKLNPLIGFTLRDMGYDENYSLKSHDTIQKVPDFDEVVKIIDDTHLELNKQVLIDIGALGKGYFVDVIAQYLKKHKLKHFLVNGSGDIYYQSEGTPIRVGLEHPADTSKAIGMIEMTYGSMCSSANNRRSWGTYSHTIDPHSLVSPDEIIATWVIADKAVLADALATCLFFVAPENFQPQYKFEYCILNKDFKIKRSAQFNITLF